MKKEKIEKHVAFVTGRVADLRKASTSNAISDEARAEIEARIGDFEQLLSDLKQLEAAASEGETDNSESMKTQMAEILARVKEMEDSVKKADKVVNNAKKVVNSKEFVNAFFETVKNSMTADDFRMNWRQTATQFVKNDVDAGDIANFLPAFVVNAINDQFVGKRHRLLELVDWTGLPCFKSLWETGNETGHVHTAGTQKTEQTLAFDPIEIRPQYVYKYITISKELERESVDSGDILIRYITRELLDRLLATIENNILTGTSPFNAPTEATVVQDANNNDIYDALAYMEDTEGAVAIMSPTKYLSVKAAVTTLNNRLATHDDVLSYLGVEEIIFNKSTYTPSGAGTWTGIWYMRPSDYKIVGDRRPDEYKDFNLSYNKVEYLTEMWVGGGCAIPNNFIALLS